MFMNHNYAKTIDAENLKYEYGPDYFMTSEGIIANPTESDYLKHHYKHLLEVHVPPEIDYSLSTYSLNRLEEDDANLCIVYEAEAVPLPPEPFDPGPKIYSKYKIVCKCIELGIWDALKAAMAESYLKDLWDAAQEFSSEDHNFNDGCEMAAKMLGKTVEQVMDVLEDCLKD